MIPVFALIFSGIVYMHERAFVEQQTRSTARRDGWRSALLGCPGRNPAPGPPELSAELPDSHDTRVDEQRDLLFGRWLRHTDSRTVAPPALTGLDPSTTSYSLSLVCNPTTSTAAAIVRDVYDRAPDAHGGHARR